MNLKARFRMGLIPCIALMIVLGGCREPDDRLIEMSQESIARQAEQNRQMVRHNDQLTATTRRLIEADAAARQELIEAQGELHQGVQSERLDLSRQYSDLQRRHDELESERRQIAQQRHRDPLIAGAIVQAAVLLACCLPLLFCFCLLRVLRHEDDHDALGELLVEDVLANRSLLLGVGASTKPALDHKPLPLDAPV